MGSRGHDRGSRRPLVPLFLAMTLGAPGALAQPGSPPAKDPRAELARETKAASDAAQDHRGAVAGIVRYHYEAERRRLERAAEAADSARRAARDAAIARLEGE